MLPALRGAAPASGWLAAAAGINTLDVALGTVPALQFAAVFQSVFSAPVQTWVNPSGVVTWIFRV